MAEPAILHADDATLRSVWTAPDGRYRLVARDWEDGAPISYAAQVRNQIGTSEWRWAADWREEGAVLDAVAAWLDDQARGGRRPGVEGEDRQRQSPGA